jgi:hypothetical protein
MNNKLADFLKHTRLKKLILDGDNYPDELVCKEYIDYGSMDKSTRKREVVEGTLLTGCKVLEKLGVKYWIGQGTLLGFYRDNNFLPNDIDLDINAYTDKEIYRIIKELPFIPLYVTTCGGHYMQFAFLDRESDVIFDINFFYDRDDMLYNRNYFGWFRLPKSQIDNLKPFQFNGNEYPAPDPEWYCRYWYGENWRLPKKYSADWTIDYRKDCKGFVYLGEKNIKYIKYFEQPASENSMTLEKK